MLFEETSVATVVLTASFHDESHALANIGCQNNLRVSVSYFLLISVHISYFDGEYTRIPTTNSKLKLKDFETKPIKYLISPG